MRVETDSPPSSELVVAASRTVHCSAGELRLRFEAARFGFICLLRGQGVWRTSSSREVPLGSGSVIAWRAEVAAALVLATPAEVAVVSIEPATSAGSLFQELYPDATLAHFGAAEGLARLRGLLALLPQSRAFGPNTPTAESLLLALIWSVHEQRERAGTNSVSDPAISGALALLERDPVVSSALQILERELARRLSVTGLAKRVGLSRSAFVRRFSAALGLPPEKYLTWLRLRRAAELLVTTDAGLAAIASEVGYASEFSFSRAFRRWYGVPPGTYRKQPSGIVPRTFALAA